MPSTYVENFATLLRALGLVEGTYKLFPGDPLTSDNTTNPIGYSDYYGSGFLGTPVDTTFNASSPDLSYINATTFHPAMGGDPQCPVVSYDSPQLTSETFWSFDPTTAAIYRYRRQQSVNLGSW